MRCQATPAKSAAPSLLAAAAARPAGQEAPLSTAGANKGPVKLANRPRRLANFTYPAPPRARSSPLRVQHARSHLAAVLRHMDG